MSVTEKTSFSLFSSFKIHFGNCFDFLAPDLMTFLETNVFPFRLVISEKNSNVNKEFWYDG